MLLRSLIGIRRAIEARAAAMSAGRRPRTILLIALALWPAALVSAQAADHPPDTMEARLLACAACHGRQGQGTDNDYFPRLAGKPAGYLMNQLVAFRDGRRRYPPMNYLLEYISDPYLRQMAEYSPPCAHRWWSKQFPTPARLCWRAGTRW
jgi:Cytochrome c553